VVGCSFVDVAQLFHQLGDPDGVARSLVAIAGRLGVGEP
jgi:hypothetical protein